MLKTVQYVIAAVTAAGIFTAASARGDADKYQPDIPQALVTEVNEARELYEKRDLETAERLLRDVISKNDDYYRAHYNLGLILQAEGKPDDAVTELKKALALQQKFPKIHDNSIFLDLGRAYYDGGDYSQAEAQYIKGLERKTENDPDTNKRLLVNLGNLYFQSGDLDKAKSTLEQATDEFPNSGANELRETVDEYSRRKSSEREVSTREPVKEGWVYYGLRKEGIPSAKDGTLPWRDSIFFEKVNKESPMPKPGRKVRALKRINVRAGPPISMQGSTSEWPQSKGLLAPNDEVKIDNVKQYPVSGGVYYWIHFSR